ncbi:Calmodulin-binding transcription activator 4 [Platanthera guangdongensis]|uniref:Calmodulin-binding transcription activator 4 n=1 Tax=Platanthera guangdongensis TaxID=2320717 RepID=A0ABR2N1U5_9ASPA
MMEQPGPCFDYGRLCQAAQIRWLKPSEVFFILQNHKSFPIEQQAPETPPSGSLFLFNRRVHRFFRKDGHTWRRKRDGRSVGEAHERLKVGNVDALNCYYAHGENNPYFQRRSYWMLDPDYDHIVLVHYRLVSEGRFLPPLSQQAPGKLPYQNWNPDVNDVHLRRLPSEVSEKYDSYQGSRSSVSGEVNSKCVSTISDAYCLNIMNRSESSDLSYLPEVNQALRELEEQLSLEKLDNNLLEDMLPVHTNDYEKLQNPVLLKNEKERSFQKFNENIIPGMEHLENNQGANGKHANPLLFFRHDIPRKNTPPWNDMLELGPSSTGISAHQFSSEKEILGVPFDQLEEYRSRQPGHEGKNAEHMDGGNSLSSPLCVARSFHLDSDNLESPNSVACMVEGGLFTTTETTTVIPKSKVVSVRKDKKFDSMGTIDLPDDKTAHSSDFLEMWFDQGQHETSLVTEPSVTVVQKQLFKIREISPEWSFSFERTKVVITGDFICSPSYAWAVMFGDVEVPAEIVQQGVLRCQTPELSTKKVALHITSGNREVCSEGRQFEFRTKHITGSVESLHHANITKNPEELLLLVKFVHVLLCRRDVSPVADCTGQTEVERHRKSKNVEDRLLQIIDQLQAGCEISSDILDWILQELIKDTFQQWLSFKMNGKENTNCLLSKEERGIIHMISGLGYEWALSPLVDAGVGINFRDAFGWTALHWAAHFGREKMATSLLASGAFAGAVTDPTSHDPVGKTAGAIAASSGHKGLAGYLSEADLTGHLSSLTKEECEISKGTAVLEAERAVERISERTAQLEVGGTEDELSLKDSLAAVRNSAQAAARIQAAFRAHSFRMRQVKFATERDEYGMTPEEIYGLSSSSKNQRAAHSSRDLKFDKAALSIQKKFRGWRGRKDFLTLRHHVVKIQALVRGYQVRKKYKEILWTVGVLDKVVLRWRRRGVGLRGFHSETNLADKSEEEDDDIIKAFRKQKVDEALDQAFSRVVSMVESPRARKQYRRMLQNYHDAKAGEGSVEEAIQWLQDNFGMMQDDEYLW